MELGLQGRAYIVTGGTRGLGLASARALAADGAHVLVSSRDPDHVEAACREIGGDACGLAADLADPQTPTRLVETALERFGRLDGGVLSVGGPPQGAAGDIDDDTWRASFESIFLGQTRMARTLLQRADEQVVTLVLSTSVVSPAPPLGISNGLRPGLAGVAKSLADQYASRGSRVVMLLPGRIETDRTRELEAASSDPAAERARIEAGIPLGRYGRPEEFGAVAAFVTSPAASYLTGTAITVDGGATRTW